MTTAIKALTLRRQIRSRVHNNRLLLIRSQVVLTLDLILTTIHRPTAGPDINMVLLAVLPILGTCCASVLKADVLLQIRRPEDLALLELSGAVAKVSGLS